MAEPALSPQELALVDRSRVAHVGTIGADGAPHVVPVCPALDGGTVLFATQKDRKVQDLRHESRISLCCDHYLEDWDSLEQVLLTGSAQIAEHGEAWSRGRDLLYAKFPQYEPQAAILEGESVIVRILPQRVSSTWRRRATSTEPT